MARKQDPNMVHCDACGEDYSATYKFCPFCGGANSPSSQADAVDEGGYAFDGQDVFDQPDTPPAGKGGKRLPNASGQRTPPPPINWPRLITFLCSLVIIAAALVMVFTVVYPHLRNNGADPAVSPSQTASATPSPTLSPEGLASMTLDTADLTLQPQQTHSLTVTFDPADWSGTVTWTSSDETCATVSEDGVVTNVNSTGTQRRAVITATAGGQTVTCTVYCQSTGTATPEPTTEPASETGDIPNGSKGTIMNAASGLRVRSGPGTTYDVLASLKNGDSVTVVSYAGNDWYEIRYSGSDGNTTGYIMGDYISVD